MRYIIILLLLIIFLFSGCLKNPVEPKKGFYNPDDSVTNEINVIILSITEEKGWLVANVSVTNQNFEPIKNLELENFGVSIVSNMSSGWVKIGYLEETGTVPISVAMTMDYSGSMNYQSIEDMEEALVTFINLMKPDDRGEIIKFSDYVEVMQSFTNDKQALINAVYRDFSGAGGGTALNDSIYQGLVDAVGQPGQRAVIALTDGGENSSYHSFYDIVNVSHNYSIPVFTIGLEGEDFDEAYMRSIAEETNGKYYYAPDSSQLAEIYISISRILSGIYRIYCKGFLLFGDEIIIYVYYNGMSGFDSYEMTFNYSSGDTYFKLKQNLKKSSFNPESRKIIVK